MSFALSVADWMTIVQLIYRMNCLEDSSQYQYKILEIIKMIVPFDTGIFNLADHQKDDIVTGRGCGYNLEEADLQDLTINGLNNNAFLKSLLLDPSGLVSRGPDRSQFTHTGIHSDNAKLIPADEQHVLSIILYHKEQLLGYILLFRGTNEAEFSTRDVCILGNLKNHIALQLYKLTRYYLDMNNMDHKKFVLERALDKYGLSKRELEILSLIYHGKTDPEICEQLFVTSSTFKKHLNHVYEKMEVSSRVKLLKLIDLEMK